MSKLDLPDVREALPGIRAALAARGTEVLAFSAATGEGVPGLLDAVERLLGEHPVAPRPRAVPLPGRRAERRESEGED